jgi:hypothetical protein
LPLIPSGVIEFIPFDRTLQVAIHLAGQGGALHPPFRTAPFIFVNIQRYNRSYGVPSSLSRA